MNGVRWASERILALDAKVPGGWEFPSQKGVRDKAWADSGWQRLVPVPLVAPLLAPPPQLLSVAPMMDYTTVHFRYLCRLLSANTWLYTVGKGGNPATHSSSFILIMYHVVSSHPEGL